MLYADGRAAINMEHFASGTTCFKPGFAFDHLSGRWLAQGWYIDLKGIGLYGPWPTESEALDRAGFIRQMAG